MNRATDEDYLREEAINDLIESTVYEPATGCWIDDRWGQYGITRLIEIAQEYGFTIDECEQLSINAYRKDQNTFKHCGIESHVSDWIFDIADSAENWLNENVAKEGYSFGWDDGEFFYMKNSWFYD